MKSHSEVSRRSGETITDGLFGNSKAVQTPPRQQRQDEFAIVTRRHANSCCSRIRKSHRCERATAPVGLRICRVSVNSFRTTNISDIKLLGSDASGNMVTPFSPFLLYSDQVLHLLTGWDNSLLTQALTVRTERSDEFQRRKGHLAARTDGEPLEARQLLLRYGRNKTKMPPRTGR